MAKKKPSVCAQEAIFANINVLPEEAQKIALTYLRQTLGDTFTAGKAGKELNVNEQLARIESVGITGAEVGKAIQKTVSKKEAFESLGRVAKTDKGTKMGAREVLLEDLVSHFTLAPAQARIVGLVRQKFSKQISQNIIPTDAIHDFISRVSVGEAILRSSGIPVVINKVAAATAAGPMHYSFLALGDIGRVFIKTGNTDLFGKVIFNSSNATENIQFQNIAEAARRIIEESSTKPETLAESLRTALTMRMGSPIGKAKTLNDQAMKWANSPEGLKLVDELVAAMTEPKFIETMIYEDTRLASVGIALSRADGYKLAADTLKTIADLEHFGEKLQGYGRLLLDNGILDLFGKDPLAKLTPEKLNLAFAQQAIALFFSHLDDTSLAAIKSSTRKARGAAKDAAKGRKGKKTKENLNQANKEVAVDTSQQVEKIVADDMANDPNVRNMESSLEASSIARQYYLENLYGTITGGLAKAVSKVSDIATMGTGIKTRLIGAEQLRLENSAIITAELRKFADSHGQDVKKFNDIFRLLQGTTDESRASIIAGLSKTDQQIANQMATFIDYIYGIGEFNKLIQEGIHTSEMVNSLRLVGQGKQADMFVAMGITNTQEAKDFWKLIELGEDDNILEILSKYHAAIQLSMIKPHLAQSLSIHFSHTADGLTREEAIRQGYKPIAAEGGLSEFLAYTDGQPLFHPEIVSKMQALNHYLEFSRGFKSDTMQKWVNKLDPIISVLKSSNTIWRPGHHMTSLIGNTLFNVLAGVWEPKYYSLALKTMKTHHMIDDLNVSVLDEIMKTNIPEGYIFKGAENGVKIALKDPKTGKITEYTLDFEGIAKGATAVAGVRITPRRAKDVVENELMQGTVTGPLMKNPASRMIASGDHELARLSAARDNVARYALFIKELEKGGPYTNLEDAFLKAGSKVHEFHPTVGTLTAEERKYARRLFYFYTWQKQAFFKIMEMAANTPAVITMPSKLQFAIAESQGLNPESFGQPFDPTQLFAAYNTNTVYGPQWQSQFGAAGIKPAIPQLDVMDSYLSQFQTTPGAGLWENIGNNVNPFGRQGLGGIVGKNISPLFKIPAELATGNKIGDVGKITDIPQYLLDQTGLSAPSRVTGQTPWGPRSDIKTDQYSEANKERQLINYILGIKYTYYQSPSALDTARQERLNYFKRINHNGQ